MGQWFDLYSSKKRLSDYLCPFRYTVQTERMFTTIYPPPFLDWVQTYSYWLKRVHTIYHNNPLQLLDTLYTHQRFLQEVSEGTFGFLAQLQLINSTRYWFPWYKNEDNRKHSFRGNRCFCHAVVVSLVLWEPYCSIANIHEVLSLLGIICGNDTSTNPR